MARDFAGGASDYLDSLSTPITDYPCTIACWFNSDSASARQTLVSISDPSNGVSFKLEARGDLPNDPVAATSVTSGGAAHPATTTTGYTTGTWHHACGVWIGATSREGYIDGGSKGTNTGTCNIDEAPAGIRLGQRNDRFASRPLDGRMYDVAVWNVALTEPEIAALAQGISPLRIRPQHLVRYWPIYGARDPEPELMAGAIASATGSVAYAPSHRNSPILIPRAWTPDAAAAAPSGLTINTATHGHTADNLQLSLGQTTLSIHSAAHAQAADQMSMATGATLVTHNAAHAHAAGNLTLAPGDPVLNVVATHVHVINLDTQQVYYTKGGPSYPSFASTMKLLNAHILLQHRPTMQDLAETTVIQAGDIKAGTGSNLLEGDVISLHALLADMLIPSSNTACMAIARVLGQEWLDQESGGVGDPYARFVDEMNSVAAALGMTESVFVSPSGDSSGNTGSPADLNKVAAQIKTNAILRDIWRWERYRMPVNSTTINIVNTNAMVSRIGVVGGKTGSLGVSNLQILYEAPNGQLVSATIMGSDGANRFPDMETILSQLLVNYPDLATPTIPFTPARAFDFFGHAGGWWDPSDTAHMWQDAAGTTPVASPGDPVGRWEPKAGSSGIHWRQATSAARPTYQSGAARVVFDGTDDFLDLGDGSFGGTSLFCAAGQQFVMMVKAATTQTGTIFSKAGATESLRTLDLYQVAGGTSTPAIRVRGVETKTGSNLDDGNPHLFAAWWDGEHATVDRGTIGQRHVDVGTAADEAGQNILLGARQGGTASRLNGDIRDVVLIDAHDSDLYRRMRDWFNGGVINAFADPTGGAALELVIANAVHAQTAQNMALASGLVLTIANAGHAQAADNLTLNSGASLIIASADHAHAADTAALSSSHTLSIADALHAHAAGNVQLVAALSLVIADAAHAHGADNVSLDSGTALLIHDAGHAHSAEGVILSATLNIVTHSATHAQTADTATLGSTHGLGIHDASHAHTADHAALLSGLALTIQDAYHAHVADGLSLTAALALAVHDALHAHSTSDIALSADMSLVIHDAGHAQVAGSVTLIDASSAMPSGRVVLAPRGRKIILLRSN